MLLFPWLFHSIIIHIQVIEPEDQSKEKDENMNMNFLFASYYGPAPTQLAIPSGASICLLMIRKLNVFQKASLH